MQKLFIILIVLMSFTAPLMAYGDTITGVNSTFLKSDIKENPQFGSGERYIGNTEVQIIAPGPNTQNVAPAPKLPDKLPEGQNIPQPAKFEVQPSQVYNK